MKKEIYYENVNLACVENGFVLNYTEVTCTDMNEHNRYEYKQEIYEDDKVNDAIEKMKILRRDLVKEKKY